VRDASGQAGAGRPLVLIVDDDLDVATALEDTLRAEFEVLAVTAPEAALPALEQRDVAVLLADQRMPGLGGAELLAEARRRHPDVVGVLITGYADLDAAMQAINQARAFALVGKPWDVDELLVVVRRAVDAHRALRWQRADMQGQQRELQDLEALSRSTPAPLTAQRFGAAPVRERAAEAFQELSRGYAGVLEHAFEQRIYRVSHPLSDELRGLADRLGALRAGPRDVLDLHSTVLKQRLASASVEEGAGYADEGRLLVLELMGHLVSYYRGYALGVSA
jgi:FixJ family two-component response regulator